MLIGDITTREQEDWIQAFEDRIGRRLVGTGALRTPLELRQRMGGLASGTAPAPEIVNQAVSEASPLRIIEFGRLGDPMSTFDGDEEHGWAFRAGAGRD